MRWQRCSVTVTVIGGSSSTRVACRITIADQLALGENVPAAALAGPVIDELIDRPRRQQRAALALMPRLGARLAARWILAAPRRRAWRISAGRLRRIARGARQLALQRRDPLVLASDLRGQLLDLRLKPLVLRRQRQQHRHDRIATLPIDPLGLAALHTPEFAVGPLCPPHRLNAYLDPRNTRGIPSDLRPCLAAPATGLSSATSREDPLAARLLAVL